MNKKHIIILAGIMFIIVTVLILTFGVKEDTSGDKVSTTLYYINSDETSIIQQPSTLHYSDADDLVYKITDELKKSKYNKTIPEGTKINFLQRNDDNTMLIDLNHNFLTKNIDYNTLRAYAYIKSICAAGSIIDVSGVKVSVNGADILTVNGDTIDYLHAGAVNLSSDMVEISDDVVALYHLTKEGTLRRETYSVAVSGKLTTEQFILERLGDNPQNTELKSSYSNKDDIISVETTNGICFVNVKKSFVSANTGNNKEYAVIYSIVNSLTELDDVDGVIILVDGRRTDTFGTINISGILTADKNITQN